MALQQILVIVLFCTIPIIGICLLALCKKKVWKIIGAILFIVGTIMFVHEGVWHMLLIYLGYA